MSIREFTMFNVLDPRTIDPDRNLVLALASNRARVTTNAFAVVYYESIAADIRPVLGMQ